MEEKKTDSATSPAATVEAPPVAENTSNTAQEVTSTTPNEPTKRSLRVNTWKKLRDTRCGVHTNHIFYHVPAFVNSDKAAELLAQTEEFKNAKKVRVSVMRALNPVKLQALIDNKDLYLPSTRESKALYLHVDVPEDANEEKKKQILQDFQQHRSEITFENKVEFDLVVIGVVVVSREGYCIGRGNGFVDQELGLLISAGCITPKTTIAAVVHDLQVVDTLPSNLFEKHDVPVDLIVTPTEVIRVAERLPRPAGIYWDLLSERRLKFSSGLQDLKEIQEKEGKVITLKQEDPSLFPSTDKFIPDLRLNNYNYKHQLNSKRRYPRKPRQSQTKPIQTSSEQQGDNQHSQRRPIRGQRKFNPRHRRQTKSEGDQSEPEGKSQERRVEGQSSDRRKQRQRKPRPPRDFCVRLSNLRNLRVTELKKELRKRECNPLYITWKGQYGRCVLHFGRKNGDACREDEIDKVMKSLSGLQITVPVNGNNNNDDGGDGDGVKPVKTKTINVNVELIKFSNKDSSQTNGTTASANDANVARIESVDTTTV